MLGLPMGKKDEKRSAVYIKDDTRFLLSKLGCTNHSGAFADYVKNQFMHCPVELEINLLKFKASLVKKELDELNEKINALKPVEKVEKEKVYDKIIESLSQPERRSLAAISKANTPFNTMVIWARRTGNVHPFLFFEMFKKGCDKHG